MVPRLAMFNDIAGFGRCSTTIALPVISVMGVQVCPVPTAVLSSHLGYQPCAVTDLTDGLGNYINAWDQLGLTFHGLYCGFLSHTAQADCIRHFLGTFQPSVFLLDPVMGDHGRLYTGITHKHCDGLRELASHATILTPNLTEACLLTGTAYKDDFSKDELSRLMLALSALCPGDIVITGINRDDIIDNLCLANKKQTTISTRKAGISRPGTGDLFASVLVADALKGVPFLSSVEKACCFVADCIALSEKAGTPPKEGVLFEQCLPHLFSTP